MISITRTNSAKTRPSQKLERKTSARKTPAIKIRESVQEARENVALSRDSIAVKAYEFYQRRMENNTEGNATGDWLMAEAELQKEMSFDLQPD